jgi:putative FmdB family regulatory protein
VPIYEYVCQSCHYRFEVKQSVSDTPVSACTRCGQTVTKVISAPAIMFKGSGWYVTDYSDKLKPGTEAKAEEKASSTQKKDGSPSADASPAATPPAPSNSSTGPASPPAAAGSSASPTTPATPSSSTK